MNKSDKTVSMSVVVPAYNEKENISEAAKVFCGLFRGRMTFEVVFVDDGSKDGTWEEIELACAVYDEVRAVRFSRNFGKEAAIAAGLAEARGECVVVIDCDLQHPPEKILEMYDLWKQGYEVVEGVKTDRGKESALHRLCAKTFYSVMGSLIGIDMSRASDFKLLDRCAVDVLLTMDEKDSFFRALSSWIGFKTGSVEFEVRERAGGTTKWSVKSLTKYAINNITSFSGAPMVWALTAGFIFASAAVIMAVAAIFKSGSAAGMLGIVAAQFFTSGVVLMFLGIIGYYISKMYNELKDRPKYIIAEKCGDKSNDR